MLQQQTTINCRGQLVNLKRPVTMGILNITPDSFYEGSRFQKADQVLRETEKMLAEGATFIDVGGMSSRPGAEIISEEEELGRVLPVLEAILNSFPECLLSVDTIRAKVAKESAAIGVHLINDISAGKIDPAMYSTVADLGLPYILMHMKGTPKVMQKQAQYEDLITEILDFLIKEIGVLRSLGIKDIILDAGFGFGKTIEHNFLLLKKLHVFNLLEVPILVGLSRKSMIWKTLKTKPENALNGSSALHMVALQQGAKILRVHDVKAAEEVITLWEELNHA